MNGFGITLGKNLAEEIEFFCFVIVLILPDEQEYTIVLLGLATFINVRNVAGGDLSRMLGKGDQQALCNEAVLIGNGILGFIIIDKCAAAV